MEALTKKVLVLGIDGMDPKFTKHCMDKGGMKNLKVLIERGSARADLEMMGAQPTVTPPMWTTLATGAYPYTHGITAYNRQSPDNLGGQVYNMDSKKCQAEQVWNCFAEAGKKTLVWHWPGSSWPPSSDSPNLHVVDGTQPGALSGGVASVEGEFLMVASDKTEEITFKPKAATNIDVPCVITDLKLADEGYDIAKANSGDVLTKEITNIVMSMNDSQWYVSSLPLDVAYSTLKPASGWAEAPEGAKEFTLLLSGGLTRRVGLILRNEKGVYDKVALYKSKKETEPYVVLEKDVYTMGIKDTGLKEDKTYNVTRSMRVLELAEDGSKLQMYISPALDMDNDTVWSPKRLYKEVTENCGFPPASGVVGTGDEKILTKCLWASWDSVRIWQTAALNHLIETEDYDAIFSHYHNVDGQAHQIMKFLRERPESKISEETAMKCLENVYEQTDNYLGAFLHLLDKGWTILVTSDHGQCCPEYTPCQIGESGGVSVRVMQELGFTELKKDENGNELREIDWEKTKAVAIRTNHIYINLKGRDKHGIVDPKDKFEVEEEIMTALYGYRHPETGKRVVSVALRNKDAMLLGLGGPESGDICYWIAGGYNYDHCDALSTVEGVGDTSMNSIFVAAGPGIKAGYTTDRVIRQVDFAPTVAVLGGVRMPAQCEGAPVYQIFDK